MKKIKITGGKHGNLFQLYESLGGEVCLEKILLRFYETMSTDIMIGFFFDGKSKDELRHIAMMQKAFLMKAWGACESYSGKPPAKAHQKLPPILTGHFNRRLVILEQTLKEFNVSETDIHTWLSFEDSFLA